MSPNMKISWRADVFSGSGIGLLIGILISLSLSSVVGAVLSGLTALLAAFLGGTDLLARKAVPNETLNEETGQQHRVHALRAGSLGFACTLGIMLGLFIRTQNLLGVSAQDQFDEWKQLGISEERARELVVYQQLNIVPTGAEEGEQRTPSHALSVLYTGRLKRCASIEPKRYQNTEEVLRAWEQEKGRWEEMARAIEELGDEKNREAIVDATWRLVCAQDK